LHRQVGWLLTLQDAVDVMGHATEEFVCIRPSRRPVEGTFAQYAGLSSMFFFFSNRLGCLGSLLLSGFLTVALLLLLGIIRF